MGDPRKIKKKYRRPKHPWRVDRIEVEKGLLRDYGLRNKKELWKAEAFLRKYHRQARKLLVSSTDLGKKEEKQIFDSMRRMSLLKKGATLDDILALKIGDILDRRLQTHVYKKGFTNTLKHARQLIVHGHVTIGGGKVTSPSYMVKAKEEDSIQVI
ncbi:MAG: 30S ribosomal protein S4 [Candidatus Hydrothermarchaeota archaeon]|jgi:small subunit ribosomal protein S4|nr:30S ribosomal protein S4 [Candidatus Hydrothermarchaeota archaeon]